MQDGRGRRQPLRTALAAGVLASAVTAMVMAVTSPAERSSRDGDDRSRPKARNVIFLHGDGMGIAHRELIRLATKGHDGDLAMNELRYAGWSQTDAADPEEAVTDSAAAATAFASGVRTFNGAVGVDVNERSVPTLLERARAAGRRPAS